MRLRLTLAILLAHASAAVAAPLTPIAAENANLVAVTPTSTVWASGTRVRVAPDGGPATTRYQGLHAGAQVVGLAASDNALVWSAYSDKHGFEGASGPSAGPLAAWPQAPDAFPLGLSDGEVLSVGRLPGGRWRAYVSPLASPAATVPVGPAVSANVAAWIAGRFVAELVVSDDAPTRLIVSDWTTGEQAYALDVDGSTSTAALQADGTVALADAHNGVSWISVADPRVHSVVPATPDAVRGLAIAGGRIAYIARAPHVVSEGHSSGIVHLVDLAGHTVLASFPIADAGALAWDGQRLALGGRGCVFAGTPTTVAPTDGPCATEQVGAGRLTVEGRRLAVRAQCLGAVACDITVRLSISRPGHRTLMLRTAQVHVGAADGRRVTARIPAGARDRAAYTASLQATDPGGRVSRDQVTAR